jgi:hypothetical protein
LPKAPDLTIAVKRARAASWAGDAFLADDDRRERFFDMFFSPVLERGDGMFTGLGSRVPEARCIDGE